MPFDPAKHHRRSIRMSEYDYSQAGLYFITICTYERRHTFGRVSDGIMHCSDLGYIANEEWNRTAVIRPQIQRDEFVVMPNHIHGIIAIKENDDICELTERTDEPALKRDPGERNSPLRGAGTKTIGAIVGGYKSSVTAKAKLMGDTSGRSVWQLNYFETVIRNEEMYNRALNYIINNPIYWTLDRYHSEM